MSFDVVGSGVADSAVDQQCTIGDPTDRFRAELLAHRGFSRNSFPAVEFVDCIAEHGAKSVDIHGHLSEVSSYGLAGGDRLAKGDAFLRIRQRKFKHAFGCSQGGRCDEQATLLERLERLMQALAFDAAEQVFSGYLR